VDDFRCDDDAVQAAQSAYHEIRVIDALRPHRSASDRFDALLPIEELFARIRRQQSFVGASRPVLVRLPPGAENACALIVHKDKSAVVPNHNERDQATAMKTSTLPYQGTPSKSL